MEVKIIHLPGRSPQPVRRWSHQGPLNYKFDNFERSSSLRLRSSSNYYNNDSNKTSPKKKISEKIKLNIADDFIPPDPELSTRIVEQVEFYFSDVNVMKDTFLLQHMKHNKDGYISLKLLSGFKRIKQLVNNWHELAYALDIHRSKLLQLNSEKTKLRRVAPLPSYDETTPTRTIVALDMPLEKPVTIKNVVNLFEPCGKIDLVRILLPKNPIPADVRGYLAATLPELQGNDACGLVEFSDVRSVQCALQRKPASPQASPLVWGTMRVISLMEIQAMKPNQLNVMSMSTQHRASFQSNYPLLHSPSPIASPCKVSANRRHSCPSIQLTPLARRRVSISLPDNVIRMPRGPDGTRGFRDRLAITITSSDSE